MEGTEAGIDEDEIVNIEPFRGGIESTGSSEEPLSNVDKGEQKKMSEDDKPKPKKTQRSNFATLASLNQETSDDDEEQGQAFYAGGSERSGQQVLGPPRKNPIKDYVTSLFQAAQSGGAGSSSDREHSHGAGSSNSGGSLFAGSGFRLGQTDDDHVVIPGASSGQAGQQQSEQVILKLWRQGFSINDGDLRPYDDPANREFFDSILKGEIPAELRKQNKNMVHMDIEDHRGEDFKKPAKRFTAFAGEGHSLGSPVPNVIESSTAPVSVDDQKANEEKAQNGLGVNDSEPTTMIQIRLADGSRLTGRFNHTHTVDQVRQYIIAARPNYATQNFVILSSFPPKELTEGDKTLKESGLLNATIMQRLK